MPLQIKVKSNEEPLMKQQGQRIPRNGLVVSQYSPKNTKSIRPLLRGHFKSHSYFYDLNLMSMTVIRPFPTHVKLESNAVVPVATKLIQAAFKRLDRITKRSMHLSWKQTQIKKRLIIFQHTQQTKLILLKAELQYRQSLADMRRQTYLWRRVEQSAMRVEKAVTICQLRKLQKQQLAQRISSKNMVKKMMDNTRILIQPRPKPAVDTKQYMPPISRFTLRELDVVEIYSNMQLRHDLIFDSDMQFRPNLDGDKGTVKAMKAAQYWKHIQEEILDVVNKTGDFVRMPYLLTEIKSIMQEMFVDTEEVIYKLTKWDIDEIVGALRIDMDNGISYMVAISDILHVYCAPCRDELIDDMVALYQARFHVDALSKCLSILEKMRLDFANHSLRTLRPILVQKSFEVEYSHFKKKSLTSDIKTSVPHTYQWIKTCKYQFGLVTFEKSTFFDFAMMQIITNSYMSETGCGLPETFKYDIQRINQFHNDWQDIAIMNTLLVIFKQFSQTTRGLQDIKKILWLLLNDAETTMENVVMQMVQDAGDIRGYPLTKHETNLMQQLVDSTLSIDSDVYLVIQRKTADNMLYYLMNGEFDKAKLKSTHLDELLEEVQELCIKIKKLVVHNSTTYAELYSNVAKMC